MRYVNFEQIDSIRFEPSKFIPIPHHKLSMWPGFDVRLAVREAGLFLNIEPCYKVVRMETALEVMRRVHEMCESRGSEYASEIAKEFDKAVIVTVYNNKTYLVSEIA